MHICYHSPQSMTSLHSRYDSPRLCQTRFVQPQKTCQTLEYKGSICIEWKRTFCSMDDQHKLCGAYKLCPEGTSFGSRALMPILAILYGFALKINRPAGVNPEFIGSLPCQPPQPLRSPAASIDASSQAAIFPYSCRARFDYTCRIREHVSTEFG